MSGIFGYDFSRHAPGDPLTDVSATGVRAGLESILAASSRQDGGFTIADAARLYGLSSGSPLVVGSPSQVADQLEEFADEGGADGFILSGHRHAGPPRLRRPRRPGAPAPRAACGPTTRAARCGEPGAGGRRSGRRRCMSVASGERAAGTPRGGGQTRAQGAAERASAWTAPGTRDAGPHRTHRRERPAGPCETLGELEQRYHTEVARYLPLPIRGLYLFEDPRGPSSASRASTSATPSSPVSAPGTIDRSPARACRRTPDAGLQPGAHAGG